MTVVAGLSLGEITHTHLVELFLRALEGIVVRCRLVLDCFCPKASGILIFGLDSMKGLWKSVKGSTDEG